MIFILSLLSQLGSFYDSSIEWTTEEKKVLKFDHFKGKWVVMSMMYTACPGSCPLIVQKMRKIEAKLQQSNRLAEFLLITFDPKRDSPEVLAEHKKKIGITEKNWHFLQGSIEDSRQLSMLLGIKYAQDPETLDFMHDNKIVLLNPKGEMVARIEDLGDPETEFLKFYPVQKK